MASTREKRANAGNRMALLLENEDADDFYSSAYGGFQEEEDDHEFSGDEESESEDTDSDISIDENDEPVSDEDDDQNTTKRKRRVVTKAYKEPTKPKIKKEVKKSPLKKASFISVANIEKKRMRESTTKKSLEVRQRQEAVGSSKTQDHQKKKQAQSHAMTQEQLLEEASITELKNLKSLEMFQRLELEKKKTKLTKQTNTGPFIRYHSVTMPVIEVESENGVEKNKVTGKCTRNFVTFPDLQTMKRNFNFEKPKPVERSTCIVTRLPARYFDPLTKHPSANLTAFRIIREAYYTQLEKKVDPRLPHVTKWLEWRKQMRAAKQNLKALKGQ
ncbi:vacuolar protein sorting-associated protein 72 homolog isoform X2 [Parasteatoda tepidariorum]|nr:vacuolar protein sorting-associated protein 72 homolog [Parasteatoda tepidariorum]